MVEILHGSIYHIYQNPRKYGSIVHMVSCRIYVLNSTFIYEILKNVATSKQASQDGGGVAVSGRGDIYASATSPQLSRRHVGLHVP